VDHRDHVHLLRDGVEGSGRTWADLGSGTGAFTLALADLLGPGGTIHSVDRDASALRTQAAAMEERFPAVALHQLVADFTTPLPLGRLDGIVMANSLHFQRDKAPVLALLRNYLRDGGRFLLVEYDTDHGNPWVPFPMSYGTWEALATRAGFRDTRRLARVPSRFLDAIYSAISTR
jgi:SAM-dependent methyltransferase